MAKASMSRSELVDRRTKIEQEEEQSDIDDPAVQRRIHQLKEKWFKDAFNFLISLPRGNHIWCGNWDLMGPLLETFYNYSKVDSDDSPLKELWKRMSEEMQHCIQCISQHRQAQETYRMEYELSCIGPLLDILQSLDEERVTQHLREINSRLKCDEYDPFLDNTEVVSLMYEVLMFPVLLDDQLLFTEFDLFIEALETKHELALGGNQQFPGVYALLFFNRRVRTVGRRLARSMRKIRSATDLEPLQPFLSKFIGFLGTELPPVASNSSRPRSQLERMSIWVGMTSLLEFLEPTAFEEGILERYPVFFDIVLNHISSDSAEFSHAVNCLKELFKMLGCKLWLRSTLSPNVMRNTLLGQCFHTRNEKIHKDIFDLFLPFLQSLEALQDGDHEKQRRHFLYFLLHQVSMSSNFNALTRKLACKIALLIICRGYQMSPPCPPYECAHMWGPTLVSVLKDTSLHSSLRQPAFDLIQIIIVSDATALVTSLLSCQTVLDNGGSFSFELNDEVSLLVGDDAEKDTSCWSEFKTQSNITSQECREWMCIPMLWVDVLADIHPSSLPISFSKAVLWARSRLIMVEPATNTEMLLAVKTWLSSSAKEISTSFGWKIPTGSDDGGEGKKSKNAIDVSVMQLSLVRTFNRLTEHFLKQIEETELHKQWTWESKMAESLILLLLDPNDNVRQFGKRTLEHVSNTRGLVSGLKFLCSNMPSLSAAFLGLQHALKVVELDSVISRFQTLQHFFFVLYKLIKGDSSNLPFQDLSDKSNDSKYSSQGGFLNQPVFDSLPEKDGARSSAVDLRSHERFQLLLSVIAWPAIRKCLVEGKGFVNDSLFQMTCVRVLDILPIVWERIFPSFFRHSGDSQKMGLKFDFTWLHDLMDWGKSTLKVVVVYWKRAITCLLNMFKSSCNGIFALIAKTVEDLILCDAMDIDQLTAQVSRLCVSLSKEFASNLGRFPKEVSPESGMPILRPKGSFLEDLSTERRFSDQEVLSYLTDDTDLQILDSMPLANKRDEINTIVLSDDEEKQISPPKVIVSEAESDTTVRVSDSENLRIAQDAFQLKEATDKPDAPLLEQDSDDLKVVASLKSKGEKGMEAQSQFANYNFISGGRVQFKKSCGPTSTGSTKQTGISLVAETHDLVLKESAHDTNDSIFKESAHDTNDSILKELVHDTKDGPEETPVKLARQQKHLVKLNVPGPKRQVIQLQTHVGNRLANSQRLEARAKRFKPPRLDDWYRPILEINYFETVGLTSVTENEKRRISKLREVPSSFQSPEEYAEVFHPLVLEEFKAQLNSSFVEMSSWEDIYFGCLSVVSVERTDDFHFVRFVHDEVDPISKTFYENDLVLLTKEPPQKGSHDVHMVGKVERRERDNKQRLNILLIRFYFLNGSSRLNQARRQLVDRSKWHASRIMSITPQLREFQALSSIKDIPIFQVILQPVYYSRSNSGIGEQALGNLSQPLQKILKSAFNDSQLQAINAAIGSHKLKKDFELSLIQGPPGTGKTRTIVAIVSCLFASLRGSNNAIMDEESRQSGAVPNSRSKISQSVAIARAWQDAALARQLNDDVTRNEFQGKTSVRRRVLICAQSNAAVDELCSRIFSEGLYGGDGKRYKPYLVRVGNVKTVHSNSLPFFIDTLVDQRLIEEKIKLTSVKNDLSADSLGALRSNLEKLVDRIRFYEAKCASLRDGSSDIKSSLRNESEMEDDVNEITVADLEGKLRKLYEQKKQFFKDLRDAEAKEKKTNEETKALKHKLRKSILKEAEIVLTTLSGCGGDLYVVCSESMSGHKYGNPPEDDLFDAVVIDEAAQALEPATLIPLQLLKSNGTKCIMVGDPKQLPATVLSDIASKYLYECSMFERLQKAGHPVTMLTKQYRMHPEICQFPSLHFYDNKLLNGEDLSCKLASFHETKGLGPYIFYDITDGQELRRKNSGTLSLYNESEAEAAVELLRFFKKRYPSEFVQRRVGIITPYKCQLSVLRSRFSAAFGPSVTADIEFNTVDGFQGREVDILILSTVRAADLCSSNGHNSGTIGFVADVRRMNVALTRAKFSLWILGNSRTLRKNHNWAALLKNANNRNLVISVERPYKNLFTSFIGGHTTGISKDVTKQPSHIGSVRETSKLRKQSGGKGQEALHRDTRCVSSARKSNRVDTKDGNNISKVKKDVYDSKRRAGNKNDIPEVVDTPSADVDKKRLSKKAATSAELLSSSNGGIKVFKSSENKPNSSSSYSQSNFKRNLDNSEPLSDNSCDNDRNKRKFQGSTSLVKGNMKRGEAQDGRASKISTSSGEIIAKRKQQREAIDAILCSSLIPTKKSEPPVKSLPSKRPFSPTTGVTASRRPPKTKKVHTPSCEI